eukprot:TRINITY_DN649_c0_g1_i2.p1 TRINITY_DN649_c0_g1~~TRINITY_DN649_c0_g1_i2.p1  ORF type:complete len:241 (+),score=58.23 TRINITY_DN649_c0_g1_i2:261-983(+)
MLDILAIPVFVNDVIYDDEEEGEEEEEEEELGVINGKEMKVYHGKNGEYSSFMVVHKSKTNLKSIEELKEYTLLYNDSFSLSGYGVVAVFVDSLEPMHTINSFFKKTICSGGHLHSIRHILDNPDELYCSAIDSKVFQIFQKEHPELIEDLLVLKKIKLGPNPLQPFVITSSKFNSNVKNVLRNALLNVHREPEGKKIISKLSIHKFIQVDLSFYDSINYPLNLIIKNNQCKSSDDNNSN